MLEIALENACAGCAEEALAALIGAHQVHHAEDESLREVFRPIAEDESEHSGPAWALHEFCCDRLSPDEREVLKKEALNSLHAPAEGAPNSSLEESCRARLGLPDVEEEHRRRRGLAVKLRERLLS